MDFIFILIQFLSTFVLILGVMTTAYGLLFVAIAVMLLFFTFVIMPSI